MFSNIRRMQFDQSSPVHPVSESRGGSLNMTEEEEEQDQDRIPSFHNIEKEKNFTKKYAILLVFQNKDYGIWPELSSPARFRILSVTEEEERQEQDKNPTFYFWIACIYLLNSHGGPQRIALQCFAFDITTYNYPLLKPRQFIDKISPPFTKHRGWVWRQWSPLQNFTIASWASSVTSPVRLGLIILGITGGFTLVIQA